MTTAELRVAAEFMRILDRRTEAPPAGCPMPPRGPGGDGPDADDAPLRWLHARGRRGGRVSAAPARVQGARARPTGGAAPAAQPRPESLAALGPPPRVRITGPLETPASARYM